MSAYARVRLRWKFLLAVVLSSLLALMSVPVANAEYPEHTSASGSRFRLTTSEWCFIRKINAVRTRHGRNKLRPDKQLAYVARQHARTLANSRSVYHDPNISWKITRWRRLGENTGRGGGCRSVTRAFMGSSKHRDHILGRFRYVGVGTARRDGRVYVQQIFEARRDPGNVYNYP